jgi:hypothetical protein
MNRNLVTVPVLAAALALAACSASTPAPAPSPSPAALSPPPAAPAAPAYDNTQACTAFHDATTIGIPASANVPVGTDTMTWLASQTGDAAPALAAQIGDFVNAWQDTPPDTAGINAAARKIRRICAAA